MAFGVLRKFGGLFGGEANRLILKRLLAENFRPLRRYYFVAIIGMVCVAATTALTAFLMEYIVDAMTNYEHKAEILLVSLAVALNFSFKGIATYVQEVALARAGNKIVARQQSLMFRKVLEYGRGFFAERESSAIMLRLTNGAQAARSIIDMVVTSMARDLLSLIGLLAVMIYQQPILSIMVLIVGPILMLTVRLLIRRIKDITRTETESLTEILKVLQETSRGIEVVKVFSLEEQMRDRMDASVNTVEDRANTIARLRALTSPIMETVSGLAIAGVVALAAFDSIVGAETTPGQLMSFITAALLAYDPAKRLTRMRVKLESPMARVRIMLEVLDFENGVKDSPNAEAIKSPKGEIQFENVTFGYREDRAVLDDLNLTFEPGKMTALVGPSGGGKSTILNLIMRFYDPSSGAVQIAGQDLRGISLDSLFANIAFVGQDTFLFSSSIRENIRIGRPEANDEEIEAVAKNANAHEFILSLPEGYDTQVGENGTFLSGGQRQRLAIARAMLKEANILLLDEATSALDAETEARVKDALARLAKGKTTIVIAHRLSTVLDADRIHVIADGKLVESGTYAELMALNGTFRTLFEMQSDRGGYEDSEDWNDES